jgi:hypothetical protein
LQKIIYWKAANEWPPNQNASHHLKLIGPGIGLQSLSLLSSAQDGYLGQASRLFRSRETYKRPLSSESKVQYESTTRSGGAVFSYRFENAAELIGSMRLKLWVTTSEGNDLDLFVVVR